MRCAAAHLQLCLAGTTIRPRHTLPGLHVGIYLVSSLFQVYWYEQQNVADLAVLKEVAAGHGVDAMALIQSETASQQLRSNTAEVVERGGFGVPR